MSNEFQAWLDSLPYSPTPEEAWEAGRAALAAQQVPVTDDDSLMLCASDLEHSAIYDNHAEMQACIRAVAGRIRELAAAPQAPAVPDGPFLVRDVAEILGVSVPDVCRALISLGHSQRSTNMTITPDEGVAVSKWLRSSPNSIQATHALAVPQQADDADRLLREVFALCEATEDAPEVDAKNEHQKGFDRGRRFEAKQIRRAIGAWFQGEFCGRSFMGEPAAPKDGLTTRLSRKAEALRDAHPGESAALDVAGLLDEAVIALSAPQAPAVPQWLPIETAPKDRHILAFGDGSIFTECSFVASWRGKDRGWLESFSALQAAPTHWMPLPAAPGASAQPAPRALTDGERAELERLRALVNTPELLDFSRAVVLEAVHQRERWGSAHDAGKAPQDWFWLLGYLGGKALAAHTSGNTEKALHHTISSAAALANWHAAISGASTTMRPGIDPVQRGIAAGVKEPGHE